MVEEFLAMLSLQSQESTALLANVIRDELSFSLHGSV